MFQNLVLKAVMWIRLHVMLIQISFLYLHQPPFRKNAILSIMVNIQFFLFVSNDCTVLILKKN